MIWGDEWCKTGWCVSPILFCVYIDDLLKSLAEADVGCYIGNCFVGVLVYADDLVLLVPTATAMRRMFAPLSNFVFKLTMITVETTGCFGVKTAFSHLQLFCHNTLASQTNRRTTSYKRSFAMQMFRYNYTTLQTQETQKCVRNMRTELLAPGICDKKMFYTA